MSYYKLQYNLRSEKEEVFIDNIIDIFSTDYSDDENLFSYDISKFVDVINNFNKSSKLSVLSVIFDFESYLSDDDSNNVIFHIRRLYVFGYFLTDFICEYNTKMIKVFEDEFRKNLALCQDNIEDTNIQNLYMGVFSYIIYILALNFSKIVSIKFQINIFYLVFQIQSNIKKASCYFKTFVKDLFVFLSETNSIEDDCGCVISEVTKHMDCLGGSSENEIDINNFFKAGVELCLKNIENSIRLDLFKILSEYAYSYRYNITEADIMYDISKLVIKILSDDKKIDRIDFDDDEVIDDLIINSFEFDLTPEDMCYNDYAHTQIPMEYEQLAVHQNVQLVFSSLQKIMFHCNVHSYISLSLNLINTILTNGDGYSIYQLCDIYINDLFTKSFDSVKNSIIESVIIQNILKFYDESNSACGNIQVLVMSLFSNTEQDKFILLSIFNSFLYHCETNTLSESFMRFFVYIIISRENEFLHSFDAFLPSLSSLLYKFHFLRSRMKYSDIRIKILRLISFLFSNTNLKFEMVANREFVEAIIQNIYEYQVWEVITPIISFCLTDESVPQQIKSLVIENFEEILSKKIKVLGNKVCQIVSNSFKTNTDSLSNIISCSNIIPLIIEYAEIDPDAKECVFNLYNTVTGLQNQQFSLFKDMNLFITAKYLDIDVNLIQDDVILNSKLLIRYIENSTLDSCFEILKKVLCICQKNSDVVIDLTSNEYVSVVMKFLMIYRNSEKDDKCDFLIETLNFFSNYSIDENSLLMMVSSLSPINEYENPVFYKDILTILYKLFSLSESKPYLYLDTASKKITAPALKKANHITSLTVVLLINFKQWSGDLLRIYSDDVFILRVTLGKDDMRIIFKTCETKNSIIHTISRSFFTIDKWYHIGIRLCRNNISFFLDGKSILSAKTVPIPKSLYLIKSDFCSDVSAYLCYFFVSYMALPDEAFVLLKDMPHQPWRLYPSEAFNYPRRFAPLFNNQIYSSIMFFYGVFFHYKGYLYNVSQFDIRPIKFEGLIIKRPQLPKHVASSCNIVHVILSLFGRLEDGILPLLFRILHRLIKNNISTQVSLSSLGGFNVISYILSRCDSKFITEDVINQFIDFYSDIEYIELKIQFLLFLFNAKIWIRIPSELQCKLYCHVTDMYTNDLITKKIFIETIPISTLVSYIHTSVRINKDGDFIMQYFPKDTCSVLFKLISAIYSSRKIPSNELRTISYYTYNQNNIKITIATIELLSKLICRGYGKDQKFIDYFPLFLTGNHFIQTCTLRLLLNCYSQPGFADNYNLNEWVAGIISVIPTSSRCLFIDVIFSYLFDLSNSNLVKPNIRISKVTKIEEDYTMTNLFLFPLLMNSLCSLESNVAEHFINILHSYICRKAISESSINSHNIDFSLICFLISRIRFFNDSCVPMVLECLVHLNVTFGRLYLMFIRISKHIKKDIFISYFKHILLLLYKKDPNKYFESIFNYMFIIPSGLKFYRLDENSVDNSDLIIFSNSETYSQDSPFSYSSLYSALLFPIPRTTLVYASRTTSSFEWLDSDLAHLLIDHTEGMSAERYFMVAFCYSVGIHHQKHYKDFEIYTDSLFGKLKKENTIAYIAILGGLCKAHLETLSNSIFTGNLFNLISNNLPLLESIYNIKFKKEISHKEFDELFLRDEYNFIHIFIEKYTSVCETKVVEMVRSLSNYIEHTQSNMPFYNEVNKIQREDCISRIEDQCMHLMIQNELFDSQQNAQYYYGRRDYKRLWHLITSNGSIFDPEQESHYKVSSQVFDFCKNRLVKNHNFDDHKLASYIRDNCDYLDKEKQNINMKKESSFEKLLFNEKNETTSIENIQFTHTYFTLRVNAKLITIKAVISGVFCITTKEIMFESFEKSFKIFGSDIKEVLHRKYLMEDTALEIFTYHSYSFFLNFEKSVRQHVIQALITLCKDKAEFIQDSKKSLLKKLSESCTKWVNGRISNFEYLSLVNKYAGRSYNVLSQYPVFPWVISNYESKIFNFSNPRNYRDLSKPIGTLNKERLETLKGNIDSLGSEESQFLYGSLYLSPSFVIGYLIRHEPYTTLHIEVQDNRFDIPKRLFKSIPNAWKSVTSTQSDFRELIPEFFYFPDFLINENKFDLGLEDSDVELPTWAKDPFEFVVMNRKALESDYVSLNLHKWIDMIFGVTSRGEGARKIDNVYSSNFYEEGGAEHSFKVTFTECFGNVSQQIFFSHHPQKKPYIRYPFKPPGGLNYEKIFSAGSTVLDVFCDGKQIHIIRSNLQHERFIIGSIMPAENVQEYISRKLFPQYCNENTARIHKNIAIISTNYDPCLYKINLKKGDSYGIILQDYKPNPLFDISQSYIVVQCRNCTIKVLSKYSEKIFVCHKSPIRLLKICEKQDMIVSISANNQMVVSSLAKAKPLHSFNLKFQTNDLDISDNGFVYVSSKTNIDVFDNNLRKRKNIEINKLIRKISVFTMMDGYDYLAIISVEGSLMILKFPLMETIVNFIGKNISFVKISSDKNYLIIVMRNGSVNITKI